MKFLISTRLISFRAATDLSTYAHLCDPASDLSAPLTNPEAFDVWICDGEEVTSDLMDLWLDLACPTPKSMLVRDATEIPRLREYANGRLVELASFPEQKNTTTEWEELILQEAEMLYARARSHARIQRLSSTKGHGRKTTVVLVGAGIMNLMTAELLVTHGHKVRIVDAGPDPQSFNDCFSLGITHGGGNARMFSHTEADNYNEKGCKIYQDMHSIFRKTVGDGGWSIKSPLDFTAAELAWVGAFESVPVWLAKSFKDNIESVNRDAGQLWMEYIDASPQLFQEVGFCKDILRMYMDPVARDAAIERNRQLGAIVQVTSLEEFLAANPGFRYAATSNQLSGAITVQGFTVNIHSFVVKLIKRITDLGGEFQWKCQVQRIHRNPSGEVSSLESQLGHLEADHFVVSPGVTGNGLLSGTASENLIHGVLGVWLQIPNLHPQMQHSIKIHRRAHLVEDINVTVAKDAETGQDILIFGGGYGYVGLDRPQSDCMRVMALLNELEEVARIYFPRGYAEAKEHGTMYPGGKRKVCIRPFTPTGLGLFEMIPTTSGGHLMITGGNNTGGFAQAPAVARAVWRAIMGEQDPIHVLFNPDRGRLGPSVTYHAQPQPQRSLSADDMEAQQRPRVLLLCSDGPQHKYLRYRLDCAFPGYHCIVETTQGQVRHLREKGRIVDASYMYYHGLRRHYSGHDHQRKEYFDRLIPQDHVSPTPDLTVGNLNCRKVWDAVEQWQPELTIISGTKYIGRKLMDRAGLMINLHIGHLPEYKGNHCIFFALQDQAVDKVSATLHQMTPELDGGAVLDRVFPSILATDNEEALYARCVHGAIDRCIEHVGRFAQGEKLEFVPQENTGRTFRHRDRTPMKELQLWWKLRVSGLLSNYPTKAPEVVGSSSSSQQDQTILVQDLKSRDG